MEYQASDTRYENMKYNRCGHSGLKLPALSLGLWHHFGEANSFQNAKALLRKAFDLGITHFDLANNYGPPPGSAEETFGKALKTDFARYRDEMVISTKAGYTMWPGPYGDWGSKKYLVASLDQSLKRMGIDYVDIFYSHRPDPHTPLEETMGALAHIIRQGKALYVGLSNYSAEQTEKAADILQEYGVPLLIHQPKYSMFHREPENGLLQVLQKRSRGDRVYTSCSRAFINEIFEWDSRRVKSRRCEQSVFAGREHHRRRARQSPQAESSGGRTRPIPAANGDSLAFKRSARHLGADRRKQNQTDRRKCRCS